MATDKTHYVGEPVAAVAATSRYIAEDALELIEVDYEPLTPVADVFAAMEPDSPKVIEDSLESNVVFKKCLTWGEVDRAFEEADHVFTESFRWNRVGANPMETFGTITEWCDVTAAHLPRQHPVPGLTALAVAGVLGIPSNKFRLISQQRGGSFGGKGNPRGHQHHRTALAQGRGAPGEVDRRPQRVPDGRRAARPGTGTTRSPWR